MASLAPEDKSQTLEEASQTMQDASQALKTAPKVLEEASGTPQETSHIPGEASLTLNEPSHAPFGAEFPSNLQKAFAIAFPNESQLSNWLHLARLWRTI